MGISTLNTKLIIKIVIHNLLLLYNVIMSPSYVNVHNVDWYVVNKGRKEYLRIKSIHEAAIVPNLPHYLAISGTSAIRAVQNLNLTLTKTQALKSLLLF